MGSSNISAINYKKGCLDIVRIEWLDSNTAIGWHVLDSALDWAQYGIINCESTGYLIYEDADRIVLAMHLFFGRGGDPELVVNVGDLTIIPKSAVIKRGK